MSAQFQFLLSSNDLSTFADRADSVAKPHLNSMANGRPAFYCDIFHDKLVPVLEKHLSILFQTSYPDTSQRIYYEPRFPHGTGRVYGVNFQDQCEDCVIREVEALLKADQRASPLYVSDNFLVYATKNKNLDFWFCDH